MNVSAMRNETTRRAEPPSAKAKEGARGYVTIYVDECKGCGLCVEACPPGCLELLATLSSYGVHPAHYTGEGCTACGICFYACPEPGAITVYRAVKPPSEANVRSASVATPGASHAPAH